MKTKKLALLLLTALISIAIPTGCASPGVSAGEDEQKKDGSVMTTIFPEGVPSSADQTQGTFMKPGDIDAEYVSFEDGVTYVNAIAPCFEITGMAQPQENGDEFYRLNVDDKDIYSDQNATLAACTAGGRVRFRTTAPLITIRAKLRNAITGMNHFTNRGAYGFDAYVGTGTDKKYLGAAMQYMTGATKMETVIELPDNGGAPQEITIDLPLYGGIAKLEIGFSNTYDTVALPLEYTYNDPVVFYGSSITQGGCVSRPGNGYFHIVTRALDASCVNLGFSGSAMGEQSVADYIASIDMSAFVMAYDYNSPSVAELEDTHYDFYKTVREGHPDTPIIFMCHPYYSEATADDLARVAVVKATYDKAVADGDKNVWFIDSENYFPAAMRDLYAVDYLHPNDLGNYAIAEVLYPVLKEALEKTAK